MNPGLCHAGSRIHNILSTLSKVIGDGGGGGFYSVKLCVMIKGHLWSKKKSSSNERA